jgi:hypothetical protein
MRVRQLAGQDQQRVADFCDFLLRVGEGREPTYSDEYNQKNNIKIPPEMLVQGNEHDLINTVYPDLINRLVVLDNIYFTDTCL